MKAKKTSEKNKKVVKSVKTKPRTERKEPIKKTKTDPKIICILLLGFILLMVISYFTLGLLMSIFMGGVFCSYLGFQNC